jgi:hypothetical protein
MEHIKRSHADAIHERDNKIQRESQERIEAQAKLAACQAEFAQFQGETHPNRQRFFISEVFALELFFLSFPKKILKL